MYTDVIVHQKTTLQSLSMILTVVSTGLVRTTLMSTLERVAIKLSSSSMSVSAMVVYVVHCLKLSESSVNVTLLSPE